MHSDSVQSHDNKQPARQASQLFQFSSVIRYVLFVSLAAGEHGGLSTQSPACVYNGELCVGLPYTKGTTRNMLVSYPDSCSRKESGELHIAIDRYCSHVLDLQVPYSDHN